MKLSLYSLILLLLGVVPLQAQDAPPANTATNGVTSPDGLAKNGTNEVVEPQVPGKFYTNSVKMELVQVPGGFWAGKYEVTQKEYQAVMGVNGSAFPGDDQPVENVCWNDAVKSFAPR